jgi:hypothetical protein
VTTDYSSSLDCRITPSGLTAWALCRFACLLSKAATASWSENRNKLMRRLTNHKKGLTSVGRTIRSESAGLRSFVDHKGAIGRARDRDRIQVGYLFLREARVCEVPSGKRRNYRRRNCPESTGDVTTTSIPEWEHFVGPDTTRSGPEFAIGGVFVESVLDRLSWGRGQRLVFAFH